MSQNIIALCVIGFFMIFPLAIGFIAQRKASGSAEDYFIQSRLYAGRLQYFSLLRQHGGVHLHSWGQMDIFIQADLYTGLLSHGMCFSEFSTSA